MALQGTLDTFALPDVLHLLAATRKTGYLRLTGSRGAGTVALSDGSIVDVSAEHAPRSVEPHAALFELLRFEDGSFLFDADAAVDATTVHEVDDLLAGAEALLTEWREIESVVPSLRAWVRLREELEGDAVTLSQAQWPTLVAVGTGTTVGGLGDRLDLAELPVSRAVRDLVELGVVVIEDRPESSPAPETAEVEPTPVEPAAAEVEPTPVEPTVPVEPAAAEPPEPALAAPAVASIEAEPALPVGSEAALVDDDVASGRERAEADHWAEFWGEEADGACATPDRDALPTARPIKARRPRPRTYEAPPEAEQRFVPLDLPGHVSSPAVASAEAEPENAPAAEVDALDDDLDEDLANAFPGLAGRAGGEPLGLLGADEEGHDGGEVEDGDDEAPISRGLLLKFLGSKS